MAKLYFYYSQAVLLTFFKTLIDRILEQLVLLNISDFFNIASDVHWCLFCVVINSKEEKTTDSHGLNWGEYTDLMLHQRVLKLIDCSCFMIKSTKLKSWDKAQSLLRLLGVWRTIYLKTLNILSKPSIEQLVNSHVTLFASKKDKNKLRLPNWIPC